MQWRLWVCAMLVIAAITPACAQSGQTSSSTLVVSMTVQSSISLEFVNVQTGTGYCQISGANTSSASLNLGIASMSGDNMDSENGGCVNWYTGNNAYNILNYVYVKVFEANTTSSTYTLNAALGSVPPANVTWKFESMTNNLSTSPQPVSSSVQYATAYGMQLLVTVGSTAASGNIGESINFTAMAN